MESTPSSRFTGRRVPKHPFLYLGGAAGLGFLILLVVVAAIFWGAFSSQPSAPTSPCGGEGGCPIKIGNPGGAGGAAWSICPTGSTFISSGCHAGDYVYTAGVEESTISFGVVQFEVVTAAGDVVSIVGPGGFAVLPISGPPVARFAVASGGAMLLVPGGWTYTMGISNATALTTLDSIVLDMGTVNPVGHEYILDTWLAGESSWKSDCPLP